jgi:hypothetical protein
MNPNITWDIVEQNPQFPWDYEALSINSMRKNKEHCVKT